MLEKHPTLKRGLFIAFVIGAILTASIGASLYAFTRAFYSPQTYTTAFAEAGVYEQLTGIVQDYTANALQKVGKDAIANVNVNSDNEIINQGVQSALNYLLANNTDVVAASLIENLKVEAKIANGVQTVTESILGWLTGQKQSPKIFAAIPTTEEVNNIEQEGLFSTLANFFGLSTIKITNLPECATDAEEKENLQKLQDGNLLQLTCTSDKIQEVAKEKVVDLIPQSIKDNADANIDSFIEKYNIEQIKADIYDAISYLNEVRDSANSLRSYVMWTLAVPVIMLGFSIIFVALALIFSAKGTRIRNFLFILTTSGFIVLLIGLGNALSLTHFLYNKINFDSINISNDVISPARNALYVQSLEIAVKDIFHNLYSPIILSALTMLTASAVLILAYEIIRNRKAIRKETKKTYKQIKKKV